MHIIHADSSDAYNFGTETTRDSTSHGLGTVPIIIIVVAICPVILVLVALVVVLFVILKRRATGSAKATVTTDAEKHKTQMVATEQTAIEILSMNDEPTIRRTLPKYDVKRDYRSGKNKDKEDIDVSATSFNENAALQSDAANTVVDEPSKIQYEVWLYM